MGQFSNISLKIFRKFLEMQGCKLIRQKGGHEIYSKPDLERPITIQSHIDPVPEFIIQNNLRILGIDKKTFLEIISDL